MNAQSEIDRITQNVADTYSALEEKGATMPAEQNSDNLPATARSVPAGGTTGVSVQADWNQLDETAADFIKNKPFGEVSGDTVTFNGDTSGVNVEGTLFKVSNAVPTYADISKGGYCVVNGGKTPFSTDTFLESDVVMPSGVIYTGPFVIVPAEMAGVESEMGLAFPEAGTYFVYSVDAGMIVTELQLNGYTEFLSLKKLDNKYLSGSAILYYDAENYLYPSPNTTDAGARLTSAELKTIINSGLAIYATRNGVSLHPAYYVIISEPVSVYCLNADRTSFVLYTAEHTAS